MFFFFQNIEDNPELKGFKLLNLDIRNNQYLGNQRFQFVSSKETNEGPYSTIIIGPNGTGKSYILRTILDIFREIYVFKKKEARQQFVSGEYGLTYSIDGDIYQAGNIKYFENAELHEKESRKTTFEFKKNGEFISAKELAIPEAFIANSIMLTDKFPIVKDDFEPYVYLGVRRENSPSTAGTRTYVTRTVDYAVDSITNDVFVNKLKETLEFLELEQKFYVSFIPKYRSKFFTGNVSAEFFYEFHERYWEYTRRKEGSPPWSKKRFDDHTGKNKVLVQKLADFCNEITSRLIPTHQGSRSRFFGYDLLKGELKGEEYELIKELRALDLISYPSISLSKVDSEFELEESSSGEAHFLSSIVALVATMKHNSLVLIDEPEISLHPNWQMKYMGFLQKIFKEYPSNHFFVATHSHFLISDLDGKKSSIVGLRREKEIIPEFFDVNTYGWSAEEVLYSIFKVRTTRNHFFEYDLSKMISLINNSSNDYKKIEELIEKFESLEYSQADPMNVLIEKAKKYLEENA